MGNETKVVPVEPTDKMCVDGACIVEAFNGAIDNDLKTAEHVYKVMLAAAPTPTHTNELATTLIAVLQDRDRLAGEVAGRSVAALVDAFLAWRLPDSVCSDLCVTMPKYQHPRFGTSLLTAEEARQMFEYLLAARSPDADAIAAEEERSFYAARDGQRANALIRAAKIPLVPDQHAAQQGEPNAGRHGRDNEPALNGPYATTADLAELFGESPERAQQFQTRMEFIAGNRPALAPDFEFPHVNAAFINAIREDGTKSEACEYLQRLWNEICFLRDAPAPDAAARQMGQVRNGDSGLTGSATVDAAAPAPDAPKCQYCGQGHAHDFICNAMMEAHGRALHIPHAPSPDAQPVDAQDIKAEEETAREGLILYLNSCVWQLSDATKISIKVGVIRKAASALASLQRERDAAISLASASIREGVLAISMQRAESAERKVGELSAQLEGARADERERCAKVCERLQGDYSVTAGHSQSDLEREYFDGATKSAESCMDEIRALPKVAQ